jgi:hypothetical protein
MENLLPHSVVKVRISFKMSHNHSTYENKESYRWAYEGVEGCESTQNKVFRQIKDLHWHRHVLHPRIELNLVNEKLI